MQFFFFFLHCSCDPGPSSQCLLQGEMTFSETLGIVLKYKAGLPYFLEDTNAFCVGQVRFWLILLKLK
jgi:hypothetical protein